MSRPPEASWIPAILMSSAAYRLGMNQGPVAATPPAAAVVLRNFRRLTRVVIVPLRVMVRTPGTAGAWAAESEPTIWFTEVRRLFQQNAICWFGGVTIGSWHREMSSTIEHRDPHKGNAAEGAQRTAICPSPHHITCGLKLWAGRPTCQAQFVTKDGPIARHAEFSGR